MIAILDNNHFIFIQIIAWEIFKWIIWKKMLIEINKPSISMLRLFYKLSTILFAIFAKALDELKLEINSIVVIKCFELILRDGPFEELLLLSLWKFSIKKVITVFFLLHGESFDLIEVSLFCFQAFRWDFRFLSIF